jgi:hypothetical protein
MKIHYLLCDPCINMHIHRPLLLNNNITFNTNILAEHGVTHLQPCYSGGWVRRITNSGLAWAKLMRLISKTKYKQKGQGTAQVVECLLSILKAFGSIPSIYKKTITATTISKNK